MSRIRTFIAAPLSKPIRDRAVALQDELARTGTEVKWVERENLHVTLAFLGEVPDKELPAICKLASDCVKEKSPFPLTVVTVGCFPNPRRPRVVWIGVGQGTQELTTIHDELAIPLMDLGYRAEERRYTPHITLGRVRSDGTTDKLSAALAKQAGWHGGDMVVQEIHVMGSELTPAGPVYTVLGRAKFK